MPTSRGFTAGDTPSPLRRTLAVALCAAVGVATAGAALAQQAGERVTVDSPAQRDLYLAGGTIEVSAEVAGDVVAAGGTVETTAAITQDLTAAGATVRVRGPVGDDVRAVGGEVTLAADAGDSVVLAGATLRVARGAKVGGLALLAGGRVVVEGEISGELRATGGTVRIDGPVAGNATIDARERLELGPGARFAGDLVYTSPQPVTLPDGVTVAGRVVHHPLERPRGSPAALAVLAILWLLGLALAAVVLLLAFPRLTIGAARLVGSEPGRTVLAGAIHLFLVPMAAIAALLTGIGAPLALAVLLLWTVAILAGWLVAAAFLADVAARRLLRRAPGLGARAGFTALAAVVLALFGAIPFLGWLASLGALLFGTGALLLAVGRALRSGPPEPSTATAASGTAHPR